MLLVAGGSDWKRVRLEIIVAGGSTH
jgi:hypothetical protein